MLRKQLVSFCRLVDITSRQHFHVNFAELCAPVSSDHTGNIKIMCLKLNVIKTRLAAAPDHGKLGF